MIKPAPWSARSKRAISDDGAHRHPPAEDLATVHPGRRTSSTASCNVLTCGSVDDGKSTLIGRLLWDASDLYDDQRETHPSVGPDRGDGTASRFQPAGRRPRRRARAGHYHRHRLALFRHRQRAASSSSIAPATSSTRATWRPAPRTPTSPSCSSMRARREAPDAPPRRHSRHCRRAARRSSPSTRWTSSIGRRTNFRAIEADFRELTLRLRLPRGDLHSGLRRWRRQRRAGTPSTCPGTRARTCSSIWSAFRARIPRRRGPFRLAGADRAARRARLPRPRRHRRLWPHLRRRPRHRRAKRPERARPAHRHHGPRPRVRPAGPGRRSPARHRYRRRARRRALHAGDSQPTVATQIEARLVWLWETPFDPQRRLPAAHGDRPRPNLVDQDQVAARPRDARGAAGGEPPAVNDIAIAGITLGRPVAVDAFADVPRYGRIPDRRCHHRRHRGRRRHLRRRGQWGRAEAASTFRLTRELLERGICRDLGRGEDDRREFQRRANEAALLLRAAGVDVKLEL